MESTSINKISEDPFYFFIEKKTFEPAKRFKEKVYTSPIDILQNWNFLGSLVINNWHQYTFDYVHPLEKEPFDEN